MATAAAVVLTGARCACRLFKALSTVPLNHPAGLLLLNGNVLDSRRYDFERERVQYRLVRIKARPAANGLWCIAQETERKTRKLGTIQDLAGVQLCSGHSSANVSAFPTLTCGLAHNVIQCSIVLIKGCITTRTAPRTKYKSNIQSVRTSTS